MSERSMALRARTRLERTMKFTLSWLKDHLDTSASLAEIVDTLTRVGLEVEGVEDPAPNMTASSSRA